MQKMEEDDIMLSNFLRTHFQNSRSRVLRIISGKENSYGSGNIN